MGNIKVGRYSPEESASHGWAGWVEDEARTWIAFIDTNGAARFYLHREESGAVIEHSAATQ